MKILAICSDGTVFKNINKSYVVRKIEKRLKRLQRQVSRKYEKNKKGREYVKTKNIINLKGVYNKSIEDWLTLEITIFMKVQQL